jgi:alginate O-acetyltransferase complex protein AlgI
LLVVLGCGIFYFDDSSRMVQFFQILFGQTDIWHDFVTIAALTDNCWLWVVALLFCMPLRSKAAQLLGRMTNDEGNLRPMLVFAARLSLSALLLVLSTALLVGATNNAFIYTRF